MITNTVYRKLLENMAEAVWMGDENEKTVYANPKFCKLVGYSLEEMIGKQSYIFWDEESAKKVKNTNTSKRKKGESSSYTWNLLSKSWEKISVMLNWTPLPDGGTIGIMTDLRELKEKESIYRQLVENMAEAVWMGDENEKTVYANPKFCKLVGYSLEEMIGKQSYIFWDEESAKKVKNTNTSKRKKGESSSYTWNLLSKSWEKISVMLNWTPLPDGGTIGIMTDLRELKEKEENEKILYNAVQYSTDAIIMCNPKWEITSWNKGAQIIFWHKNTVIWKNISSLFDKEDISEILRSDEVVNKYELIWKHKNKSKLDISVTQTHIFDIHKTEIASYLLICRDITNHRKIELEMESKYKKIREVYKSIGVIKRQSDYIFELLEMSESYHYDNQSIGDFIVTSIIMLTHVDGCELRILDKKEDKLDMISHFWFSQDWDGKKRITLKWSLAEQAYKNRKPLKIIDILKEPKYQTPALARKHGMTSLLLIPLISWGDLIWVISLYTKASKKLEIFENEFIEKYAKVIQLVLANSI